MGNIFVTEAYKTVFENFDNKKLNTSTVINTETGNCSITSYLYAFGNNVLLDYYRNKDILDEINMSYSLLNYYHGISYKTTKALNYGIDEFINKSKQHKAISLIIGLTLDDEILLSLLKQKEFSINRCSTTMVKTLQNSDKKDIALALPRKKRDKFRNIRKKYVEKGVKCSIKKIDFEQINSLFNKTLIEKDPKRELLPEKFIKEIIFNVNTDIFVAEFNDKVIGILIAARDGCDYYILFSAHDGKESLNIFHQSYFLFEEAIKFAALNDCAKVHAGRDPFIFKKNLGFSPTPLYWAGKGYNNEQNNLVEKWLLTLEKRHLNKYENEI